MRRWMIVFAIVGLFVALVAAPGAAKKDAPPHEPVYLAEEGLTTFGLMEVWTGEWAGDTAPKPWPLGEPEEGSMIAGNPDWTALMDPNYNRCAVVDSGIPKGGDESDRAWTSLEWTGKNTAVLTTVEKCPLFGPWMPRIHTRPVHITPGGAVKLGADSVPFFPDVDGEHWLKSASGCGLNGTFPVYHGTFDWDTGILQAESHFHGICDDGERWGKAFGIGKEDGPMHATFTIDLHFDM